ncbi:bacteriocin fulvocin C-related protein [Streptomyces specialis]|uniref:bacteriocin fulvocin C-related protein n=1 Tax=Streptomyces specialis TaxID=498367 RepID=UPI00073F9C52|nr:bacteriocin fulvocin C-related protein [Streptomyces specialis]
MVAIRWILAFDADCCRCRSLAHDVRDASGRRLDIMPLEDPEVRSWREAALGAEPPHAPTLLRVPQDGGKPPRAWTGWTLGVRLALRLGPRRTARVLRALGAARSAERAPDGIGRGRFLLLAGLGAAAVLGAAPAARATDRAQEWVRANLAELPRDYDGVTAHPMAYRRAIFRELDPADRAALWREHLSRYRAAHPGLGAEQRGVLDRAEAFLRRDSAFVGEVTDELHGEYQALKADAVAAFGLDEARAALATLGPAPTAAEDANCECNCGDDWCSDGCTCCVDGKPCWCTRTSAGCGLFFNYRCYGTC